MYELTATMPPILPELIGIGDSALPIVGLYYEAIQRESQFATHAGPLRWQLDSLQHAGQMAYLICR